MSFEQPPATPTPEEEKPKISVGKVERGVEQESSQEATENIVDFLSSENQGFFHKMSEGGKKLAGQAYEGLYKIPGVTGVNRIVRKIEIAYNQFWVDRHEEKAVGFKSKMEGLNLKVETFDQSKKEIESLVENFKKQGVLGVESLLLKLKDIDKQKMYLLNQKDNAQSKFEARENKIKLYTNERDRVADKLIDRYNKKLEPMEKELENLQTYKDQTDLLVVATEVKHNEQIARLDGIEKQKRQVEEALRGTGMSEKEIKKFEGVKVLEEFLAQGHEKLKIEKENLAKKKAEISQKIAKVDRKANPYRDKREEFTRVKEGRPIKMNVETRQRGQEFKGEEETRSHTREQRSEFSYTRGEESLSEVSAEEEIVETNEDKEQLKTSSYVSGWNTYLQEKYGKDKVPSNEMVDEKDFLKMTRLSVDHKLDFKDFKNILAKYYKFKKMPTEKLNKNINNFLLDININKFYQGKNYSSIIIDLISKKYYDDTSKQYK